MGLFDSIFGKKKQPETKTYTTLSSYNPVFTTWNGALYESDIIRQAVDAKARHIMKLKIEVRGSALPKLRSRLKYEPNPWQTWSQMLYRVSTILDIDNTVFIVPVKNADYETVGFAPVRPVQCSIVSAPDPDSRELDIPWLKYQFSMGQVAVMPFRECALLTRFQLNDDFFGEDNDALSPTMSLIHVQNQGIENAVKNSAGFRFMARLTNFSTDDDLQAEADSFVKKAFNKERGGVLLWPNNYTDIKQIEANAYNVDADQAKMIRENVYNYFGVSEKLIQNAATGDELDAFYNGCIEPFQIQLSEALTKATFSLREQAAGAEIIANSNRLQYMPVSQKVTVSEKLGDRGAILIDEIRELFNYAPLPDGAGQHAPIRGEYYMHDKEGENAD